MESVPQSILVYAPDLLMRQQIVEGLRAAGHVVRGAATAARYATARADEPPALVVVELDGVGIDGVAFVRETVAAGLPVIGFCAHTNVALITSAREAGATKVVSRGELARRMGDVVADVLATTGGRVERP